MSTNVIPGPWPATQRPPTKTQNLVTVRNDRVREALGQLDHLARINQPDRLLVANNLGLLVAELAHDRGTSPQQALRAVFDKAAFAGDMWPKRLRYIRLPDEANYKSDELAATWDGFRRLAHAIADLRPRNGFSDQEHRDDAILRCLEGTSHDPDPQRGYAVDLDAAAAVAELAQAFIEQLNEAVPGLRRYFQRLATYQLFHPAHDLETWRARFLETVTRPEWKEDPNWDTDDEAFRTVDQDTTRFQSAFTGHRPHGYGPSDTIPMDYLTDGFWLGGGDADNNGMLGLLPRVHLGDIFTHGIASKPRELWEEEATKYPADATRGLQGRPVRVHLVTVPVKQDGEIALSLALISDPWPISRLVRDMDTGLQYLLERREGEQVKWGPVAQAPYGVEASGTLDLIPGRKARRFLGIQGRHDTDQEGEVLAMSGFSFEQLTGEHLGTQLIEVCPAISPGVGFTPHPANTLAAALVSNLLYVKGPGNVLQMMIADASRRVETLDQHFDSWGGTFEAAKSAFVAGMRDREAQSHSLSQTQNTERPE